MNQAKFSQIYTNSKDLLGLYCEKVRAVVSLMHVIAGHLKPSLIFASKAGEALAEQEESEQSRVQRRRKC